MNTALSRQKLREGEWVQNLLQSNGFAVEHLSPLRVYEAFELAQRSETILEKQRERLLARERAGTLDARCAIESLKTAVIAGSLTYQAEQITGPGTSMLLGERQVMPPHILLSRIALHARYPLQVVIRTQQSPEEAADMTVRVDLQLFVQTPDGNRMGPEAEQLQPYFRADVAAVRSWLRDAVIGHYWAQHEMLDGQVSLEPDDEFDRPEDARARLAGTAPTTTVATSAPSHELSMH